MNRHALGFFAALALTTVTVYAQTATTISGKVVDLATYMTRDHNMDAMKMSHSMSTDSMRSEGMAASSCPATLGLVTSSGRVYLLATQMGSAKAETLCKSVGQTASLSGTVYTHGGMTALLVK
jgi:hypothetical protein